MTRGIKAIHLSLTTHCNMACPSCSCRVPERRNKTHFDWAYIENAAQYFRGIARLTVTGGEPTVHPLFCEFVPKLKSAFHCGMLILETNGHGFGKLPDSAFLKFDALHVTHYTDQCFPGCPDNTEAVEYAISHFDSKLRLVIGKIKHVPRGRRGSTMCGRGESDIAAYCDGLLYPCCAGPGVGAEGIPLTDKWPTEILNVPMPCGKCWFALQ